jgi:8-oxo-dGTP diphosphatase
MKQVAVGILIKDGLVLACQRKKSVRYPLKWEFPGGKLEEHELPQHALVRELREELAIDVTIGQLLHVQEWVYSDSINEAHKDGAFKVFYFLVPSFTGTPINRTFEQIRWVVPAELRSMDILEGNKEAVEKLIHYARQLETTGA